MKQRIYFILGLLIFGFLGCQKDYLTNEAIITFTEIRDQNSIAEIQKYIRSDESRIRYFLGEPQSKGELKTESRSYDEILEKIKLEIARQDKKWGFVKDHERNYGYPDWEKSNKFNHNHSTQFLYFIPLYKNNADKLSAVIAAFYDQKNEYYFEIIDEKELFDLVKMSYKDINRKNILSMAMMWLSLEKRLQFKPSTNIVQFLKNSKSGLQSLESRCGVYIEVCDTWDFAFQTLESRTTYCYSHYVPCGTPTSGPCMLCGNTGTGSTGTSGGGTNQSGSTSTSSPSNTTCYDGNGDPISCSDSYDESRINSVGWADCYSFNFNIKSNYQIAAVSGLYFDIFYLKLPGKPGGSYRLGEVTIGDPNVIYYFEFPYKRSDGTIIHPGQAAEIVSELIDDAENAIQAIHGITTRVYTQEDYRQMGNEFLNFLKSLMTSQGGRLTTVNNYGISNSRQFEKSLLPSNCY